MTTITPPPKCETCRWFRMREGMLDGECMEAPPVAGWPPRPRVPPTDYCARHTPHETTEAPKP